MLATIHPLTDNMGFSLAYLCVLGAVVILTLHLMRRVRHPVWMLIIGVVLLSIAYLYAWHRGTLLKLHGGIDTYYAGLVFWFFRLSSTVLLAGFLLLRGLFILRASHIKK